MTWKRKGGNRVRKEGKPNLWLLELGSPPMPKRHPQTKKAEKLLYIKGKKLRHMARNCPEQPPGPCHECSKTGGYQ
jgi:hypothetical protein